MRNVKKGMACALLTVALVLLAALPIGAMEGESDTAALGAEIRLEWEAFCAEIPSEIADLLPVDFFSQNMESVGQSVGEMSTPTAIFRTVSRLFGLTLRENLALFARLCGILVLACVLRTLSADKGRGTGRAVSLVCTLSMVLLLLEGEHTNFAQIERFFDTVRGLCVALIPLMGALYAMGGNVGAAVANHGVMSGFLALLEAACSGVAVPLASVLVALGLLDAVTGQGSLQSLSAFIRRTFTLGLSFLMMLLTFTLGLQHTLALGADTLALRTVRFAAGSFLPVVGGSVAEALRTVSGSVAYLRGTVGVGGILVIFFIFLPIFLSVALTRLALSLSSAVAGLLSCTREKAFLAELASVWGYFLAIIACLFVMTVFSLTLLARTASAVGG